LTSFEYDEKFEIIKSIIKVDFEEVGDYLKK
jgi:hypothetical protein